MNVQIVSIGILLLVAGYSVGINRRKQVLRFLKRKRVRERRKVVEIVGSSQFLLGAALVTLGTIGFPSAMLTISVTLLICIMISMYIVNRYVE